MFSGIVEWVGYVAYTETSAGLKHLAIHHHGQFTDIAIGDSIAVNGVCLTVTQFTATSFNATAVPETLRLTNIGSLSIHDPVNLERSLTPSTRIGGHTVQGHVDGTGTIIALERDGSDALFIKISLPTTLAKYVVPKGYITLDGMSITVIDAAPTWFTATLIPHTQSATIAKTYQLNSVINLEVDVMGKYIEKIVGAYIHANAH